MSGEDEQFCYCYTLNKAMNFLLVITILESIFHLGFVWPATKMIFGDNLLLYLGMMIPLAILTIVRVILMIYAQCNKLDFFAREWNYYFYLISTLVEWALFITFVTKYYKSDFMTCSIIDPVCHYNDNWKNLAFMAYAYAYCALGVPFKIWFNYINFRFYMS